jgi:IclR family KDG regulon transcriptional repressor
MGKLNTVRQSTSSVLKAVNILKCFSPSELELGVTDISKRLSISTSTTQRLLATLAKSGLLEQDHNSRKYRIGHTFYALGSLYLSSTDLTKAAEPVMKALNELTGETIGLGILEEGNVVYVLREEAKGHLRFATHVGTIVSAYSSAMGKALLSQLPESDIDHLYPDENLKARTKYTITTKSLLKRELRKIKETGISHSRQEGFEGFEAIASLIRDRIGRPMAAMSIAVPVFRINEKLFEHLTALLRMACDLISYSLGHQIQDVYTIEEMKSWWAEAESKAEQPAFLVNS